MFELIRAHPRQALWVLGLPALVITAYLLLTVQHSLNYNDGATGALLDDTWIHVRFAHSLSEGRGLMYNEGVVTSGATSPLWVILLAGVFAVFNPGTYQQVDIATLMSAISAIAAVVAVSGLAWYVMRVAWVGALAGLLTALTGRFVWVALSGMETTLFAALCVLAVWAHVADVRAGRVFGWRTGIITALATLARPEGYLLAILIGGTSFVLIPLTHSKTRVTLRAWWAQVRGGWRGSIAYVILAGSYPIACWLMDGHLLPNTFRVKSQLGEATPNLLYGFFWTPRADYGWVFILLAGLGVGVLAYHAYRRASDMSYAVMLWPLAFVISVLYLGTEHFFINHGRYVAPAIPFHALLAAVGVWWLATVLFANRQNMRQPVFIVAGLALAVFIGWNGRYNVQQVANDVSQLRKMHVALGEWLKDVADPGDLIALNDVGAIVHISDLPVLDLVGLVSPEVIDTVQGESWNSPCPRDLQLMRLMLEKPPRFIVIFQWWYPCMANVGDIGFPDILQPFNVFDITGPTVLAGGEMVVYWPIWERWPVQPAIPAEVTPLQASFEQGITLSGYDTEVMADGFRVDLWWTASAQPRGDYTVFVHVLDAQGETISQSDSRPREGRFNTTWWRTGDIIPDWRFIPMNTESLDDIAGLRIGLYPTGGGARLPLQDAPSAEPDTVTILFDTQS